MIYFSFSKIWIHLILIFFDNCKSSNKNMPKGKQPQVNKIQVKSKKFTEVEIIEGEYCDCLLNKVLNNKNNFGKIENSAIYCFEIVVKEAYANLLNHSQTFCSKCKKSIAENAKIQALRLNLAFISKNEGLIFIPKNFHDLLMHFYCEFAEFIKRNCYEKIDGKTQKKILEIISNFSDVIKSILLSISKINNGLVSKYSKEAFIRHTEEMELLKQSKKHNLVEIRIASLINFLSLELIRIITTDNENNTKKELNFPHEFSNQNIEFLNELAIKKNELKAIRDQFAQYSGFIKNCSKAPQSRGEEKPFFI